MPLAEFCEREYETIFNRQLPTLNDLVWTPGQLHEHFLGFDAAYVSRSLLLFRLFKNLSWLPRGVRMSPNDWQAYFNLADRDLPPFRFNLFVQHKRPEFISSHLGKEYQHWKCPYFRYDIDANQQSCLEKLEIIASNDALVTYACAAFHTCHELWEHTTQRTLIQSSNFVRPADLAGHARYSFSAPGCDGLAASDTATIEGQDFAERFRSHFEATDQRTLSEIISRAGKTILEIKRTSEQTDHVFDQVLSELTGEGVEDGAVLYSYIAVQLFCFLNRTSWSIVS